MNFLMNAQLPFEISKLFNSRGYHSIHTSQLPEKNLTSDSTIRSISIAEKRIVITKDSNFFDSYVLKKEPSKVFFVRTGNLKVSALQEVFSRQFDQNYFNLRKMWDDRVDHYRS